MEEFFSSKFFMPHGHCYLWKPGLVWLQTLSNGAIGLSYVAIASTLVVLVRRVKQMPFTVMYLAFGLFIVFCGITHFFDVWVIWYPNYWIDGTLRGFTALASVWTAVRLPPLLPKAQAMAEAAGLAAERGLSLEKANRELATLLEKTKALERQKTDFFANVSHELRTPLTLVIGPTEQMLENPALDPQQRRSLETIARHARQLLKQVNDLLDVAKMDAGKMAAITANVDLARLVRLCASPFDSLAREHNVDFKVEAPASLPASIDAEKIERVVVNLLSNAFKFAPPGGRVRVTVSATGGRARVEVADNGPGIHIEDRTIVFERFRQVPGRGSSAYGSSGLGLAIAKDFVELHGGTISVGDAPEKGALLVVDIPIRSGEAPVEPSATEASFAAESARAALAELREPEVAPARPQPASDRPQVLVVEDNPEMRGFLAEILGDSFNVTLAQDGSTGIAMASALSPDAIVTDMMMPGATGEDLVHAVRAQRALDAVPIVVLTAKADDEVRVRLLRQGAQDYIMKPFLPEEVRARVHNQVAMKRVRQSLQRELDSQLFDIEALAAQVSTRNQELKTTLAAVRAAREHAEQISRYKSEFLALVSHELRTPLTALRLQLDRVLRDADSLSERNREAVRRMDTSSLRLIGLIESLLEYARIERGGFAVAAEPFSLSQMAQQLADEMRPLAEDKRLALHVVHDSPVVVESDPRVWRLMIENLVGNAIKFTAEGQVTVTVSQSTDGSAQLVVSDTGAGIAPGDQQRIFEPFEHVEPIANKHTAGIGLGLALVREMAKAVGGTVELESTVGRGSSFRVRVPRSAAPARATADPSLVSLP